ncbi:MAG: alanine--tRNA ligase [Flavobacteriales bacterium]|nr:alanine--tRNA ligase [Flavobacteriales bacterium]
MNVNKIRSRFLEFFQSKGHNIVPSAPMVVTNDPTLMFTNAGMNQFKDYFLGNKTPDVKRVADTQKCLRVSGKHNDLEEVGVDTYHHTMFEMLGNWSFGDYFKEEAIRWAWELLMDYGLEKERIYVTVFGGDENDGLPVDDDARGFWSAFVPEDRILPFGKKDNFWEMGDTGPCGPCSEIHVDIRTDEERSKVEGRSLVNAGHPQVIEIWNLVFMEFNRKKDGSLEKLPQQHVDTGMGLERLCMVLQGKRSNYDTDVFTPLIGVLERMTGKPYGKEEQIDIAMRVISDHVRAVAFSIADGQLPTNNGAGYVIKRILRRAIRYGYSFLDIRESFIHQLVPVLVEQMGTSFPELKSQQGLITEVIREEENNFLHTLEKGIVRFEKACEQLDSKGGKGFPGEIAFELFDTYGFPVDLTSLMAREKGFPGIDEQVYERCLQEQKDRSRKAGKLETGDWISVVENGETTFLGYDSLKEEVHILRYRTYAAKGKSGFQLVLDKTPFYPEGGGQVGDTGWLENGSEKIEVITTRKENDLILHFTEKLPADPSVAFQAEVNVENRKATAKNHSATHLLHAALRHHLGKHVEQKGSLVDAEHLRFDFSHFQKVSPDELKVIEQSVLHEIKAAHKLDERRAVPMQEAKNMGAMALFGEKYGDKVRVIRFGDSVELCGGIHVSNTEDIQAFHIVKEASVAAGIRRIEALTGEAALTFLAEQSRIQNQRLMELETLVNQLKTADPEKGDLVHAHELVTAVQQKIAAAEKDGLAVVEPEKFSSWKEVAKSVMASIEIARRKEAQQAGADLENQIREHGDIRVLITRYDADNASIKDIAFTMREKYNNLALVIGSVFNDKPSLNVMISDDLVKDKSWDAGTWVRELAKEIQGGGGGQPFFATAGGKNAEGLTAALAKAETLVSQ